MFKHKFNLESCAGNMCWSYRAGKVLGYISICDHFYFAVFSYVLCFFSVELNFYKNMYQKKRWMQRKHYRNSNCELEE